MRIWPWLCLLSIPPLFACGSDGGGSGGARTESSAACLEFSACGGDLEGEWSVDEICFPNLFADLVAGDECDDWMVGMRSEAGGSRSYDADGSVEATRTLSLELETYWSLPCLRAALGPEAPINSQTCSSWERGLTGNITSASCVLRDDGCDCNITVDDADEYSGSYQTSDDEVIEDGRSIPYCVDGDTLTLSIERAGLVGNIVLKR